MGKLTYFTSIMDYAAIVTIAAKSIKGALSLKGLSGEGR